MHVISILLKLHLRGRSWSKPSLYQYKYFCETCRNCIDEWSEWVSATNTITYHIFFTLLYRSKQASWDPAWSVCNKYHNMPQFFTLRFWIKAGQLGPCVRPVTFLYQSRSIWALRGTSYIFWSTQVSWDPAWDRLSFRSAQVSWG